MMRICPRCPPRCRRSSSITPSSGSRKQHQCWGYAGGLGLNWVGWDGAAPSPCCCFCPQSAPHSSIPPFSQWLCNQWGNQAQREGRVTQCPSSVSQSWGRALSPSVSVTPPSQCSHCPCREEAVQKFTGRKEPVEVLRALRTEKDNFKKPKERPHPQAMLAFDWGLFAPFLEKK